MDSHYAPLDDGDMGLSNDWHFSWRALGVLGPRLGRLLGMGPGGECFADVMADGYGISAFGDDAGKTRHVEDLEHVVCVRYFLAFDPGHFSHAQRCDQFGACLRAIVD